MCRERDSNPHSHHWPRDFKSLVSTNSTITAKSGKRDSDPRPQPWQGCALPTELFPLEIKLKIPKDADSSPSYFAPAKLILINETTKQNNIFLFSAWFWRYGMLINFGSFTVARMPAKVASEIAGAKYASISHVGVII